MTLDPRPRPVAWTALCALRPTVHPVSTSFALRPPHHSRMCCNLTQPHGLLQPQPRLCLPEVHLKPLFDASGLAGLHHPLRVRPCSCGQLTLSWLTCRPFQMGRFRHGSGRDAVHSPVAVLLGCFETFLKMPDHEIDTSKHRFGHDAGHVFLFFSPCEFRHGIRGDLSQQEPNQAGKHAVEHHGHHPG